jgi:hypothetical protein
MPITNPVDIAGTAAGGVGDVSWELEDQSGQRLTSGKASDDPRWTGPNETASRFHMRNFVFVLPKSAAGILTLWPEPSDQKGASSVAIPVRFGSLTSTLSVSIPKDYDQYRAEAGDWVSAHGSPFDPTSPFTRESLTVMHVDDAVFASAEAAAEKASVLSQVPVRILNFAVQGGSAYVDLNLNDLEDGWAGISITIAEVETLIEKDLSQFPGIHKVVFGWPPSKTDSRTSSGVEGAQFWASSYRTCGDGDGIQDDHVAPGRCHTSEARG